MKQYTKPEIMFEDFALSTNISVGCEQPHTSTRGVCPITGTGTIPPLLFSLSAAGTGCDTEGTLDSTTNDGICYHNPSEENNLFNSF